RTSFAPVLSATRHRVSCWIIASLCSRSSYLARSTTSTTRQRLVFDSGRVSMIRTRSPTCASPASSYALNLDLRRTIFPSIGFRHALEIASTTVLSMASDTTMPVRPLRAARALPPSCCSTSGTALRPFLVLVLVHVLVAVLRQVLGAGGRLLLDRGRVARV